MTVQLLAAAAEAGHSDPGLAPYIAGAIMAALFAVSAIVVRSFRDVAHRSVDRSADTAHGQH